jgi:hypothetical protein
MVIGFEVSEVADKKAFNKFVSNDLKFAIIEVSEVRKRKARKVRQLEGITRQCLKLATLEGWKDELKVLTKMLAKIEDIKYECSDVVNGFDW